MIYISEEKRRQSIIEREQARWMTLVEAISQIQRSMLCDREGAVEQLRDAIGDGLIVVRWKDKGDDFFFDRGITWEGPEDNPIFSWKGKWKMPSGASFWQKAPICLDGDGSVLDDTTDYRKLALRDEQTMTRMAADESKAEDTLMAKAEELQRQAIESKKVVFRTFLLLRDSISEFCHRYSGIVEGGDRLATEQEIITAAMAVYSDASAAQEKPPNVIEALSLTKRRLSPKIAKKKEVLRILAKPCFKSRRLAAGQHRSHPKAK